MKPCNSCGKCCVKYGHNGLDVSSEEIAQWELFRPQIIDYIKRGKVWFHPETGKSFDLCPWLTKDKQSEQYFCDIYYDRPEDCRLYPTSIAEMIRDGCEMIEATDITNPSRAQTLLDKLMEDDRPPLQ